MVTVEVVVLDMVSERAQFDLMGMVIGKMLGDIRVINLVRSREEIIIQPLHEEHFSDPIPEQGRTVYTLAIATAEEKAKLESRNSSDAPMLGGDRSKIR